MIEDIILKQRQMVQQRINKSFGVEIEKAENELDIEKARSGIYADNAENRRLNRVGQRYGKDYERVTRNFKTWLEEKEEEEDEESGGEKEVKKYSSFDELWRDNEKVVDKKIEEISERKDEYNWKDQQLLKMKIGLIFNKIGIGDDSTIRLEVGKNNNLIITDYYNGGGKYIIFRNSFKKNLKEAIEDISRKTFTKYHTNSNK